MINHTHHINNTKTQMLNEIKKSPKFKRVFNNGEFETQNVTIKNNGNTQSYILLGYPMKPQEDASSKHSGVFIYKDLKSIEDTNNAITIIILITAIIFIAASTVFAFFLSNRITKPLRQLKTQAQKFLKVIIVKYLQSLLKMKLATYQELSII